jgi:thiol-disulfide isomerase/thioredoxin
MKQIIYFSAEWCGPCKNFKPIMESVSASIPVQFVDVDENPQHYLPNTILEVYLL